MWPCPYNCPGQKGKHLIRELREISEMNMSYNKAIMSYNYNCAHTIMSYNMSTMVEAPKFLKRGKLRLLSQRNYTETKRMRGVL